MQKQAFPDDCVLDYTPFSGEITRLTLSPEALPDQNRRHFLSQELQKMLQIDPAKRPEATELYNDFVHWQGSMSGLTHSTENPLPGVETAAPVNVENTSTTVAMGTGSIRKRLDRKEVLTICKQQINEMSIRLRESASNLSPGYSACRRELREWYRVIFCEVTTHGPKKLWDHMDIITVMDSLKGAASVSRTANGNMSHLKPLCPIP